MTVTLLFTDIEGSTELWEQHPQSMQIALARHDYLLKNAIEKKGRVFKNLGDGLCAVFDHAYSAVQASLDIQRVISTETWHETRIKVRTALHAGDPEERDGDYYGPPVNRVARLLSAGYGGQILISKAVEQMIRGQLSDGVELLDLGKHRLRSLMLAEHIYQIKAPSLQVDFPPLKTQYTSLNLPVQSTPFVGREEELDAIEELLSDAKVRLLTIVGPGGIGKTRLALALAERQLGNFEHGVFFVSLAALDTVEDIVPAVAHGLGFSFYEDVDHRRQLIDYLRAKSMLLLLDNFEHLLEGASLAAEIVQAAPGVQVMVTSREPLRLRDEQLFSLHGLNFPEWETVDESVEVSVEDVLEYDAARLFLSSARRSRSEFDFSQGALQPLTRICRLVQGMPLGIVLAAGWVELLSLAEIAEELSQGIDILKTDLRDVPERQRSLQAVFDTTWQQLNRREREVLQRLSVFRGGCSQEAIRQVTGATLTELKSLTGKSLLNTDRDGRHELHELLRQYAAEKLERNPEADFDAHDRHCAYYLDAIAAREDELFSPQVKEVMADIDADLENIRAAIRWAAANQRAERLDRAINPLFQYYLWRDRHDTIFRDAEIIVKGMEEVDTPEARLITARALARQGYFISYPEDLELLKKSEEIIGRADLETLDTRKDKAFIFWRLASHIIDADPDRGLELFEDSLLLFRDSGDLWGEAMAHRGLAYHADVTENLADEKRYREESRNLYEKLGNPWGRAESLFASAWLAVDLGDAEQAERLGRQSHKILSDIGNPSSITRGTLVLSRILFLIGQFDEALEGFKDSREFYEDLGHDRFKMCSSYIAWTIMHLGDYESAGFQARKNLTFFTPQVGSGRGYNHYFLACLALLREDLAEVRHQIQKARTSYSRQDWYFELLCPITLGLAERHCGNESACRQNLIESLRIATSREKSSFFGNGLDLAALLFADRGDRERAVEIYEAAHQSPYVSNSQWIEDTTGKYIAAAAENLPPEVAAAARQRGRERNPWETAKEILAELEAEEAQD